MNNQFKILLGGIFVFAALAVLAATDVTVESGNGFKDLATPTLTITNTTPVIIGTLPTGTKHVYVSSFGGATLVGSSGLKSGTVFLAAAQIASGSTVKIDGINTLKPSIYFLSNESGDTTLKIQAWGE